MTEKVLTKRLMDTLPRAEPGERIVVRDRTQRGLRVRVTDRGVKTFSVIYRFEGVQRRASLGKWPETTVAVARDRAQKVLAEVAAGHDPRRSTAETVADVAKLFDEYCQRTIINHHKVRRVLEMHVLPEVGGKPIQDLDRKHVHAIIDRLVAQDRKGAGMEVKKHLHRMLAWAANWGYIKANPLHGMERDDLPTNKDAGRELTKQELQKIWAACIEIGYPWGDLFRLLILTGQRRADWGRATWDELSDDTLTISASRYKSRRKHVVPLSEPARRIVENIPRQEGPYLFSNCEGHIAVDGWSLAKRTLDTRSGVTDYRTHDMRVTVESGLAALGISIEIRDAVLGHARAGLQKIYQKYDWADEKRKALEAWAREVTA